MMDPATIIGGLVMYFATHWMDNVISAEITNLGHHVVRRTLHVIDNDADERANHDIARTVRLAQIEALETVLEGYGRLHSSVSAEFLDAAALFCRAQRRLARTSAASLDLAVLEPLQAAVDGILAPAAKGGAAHAYADTIVDFAQIAVLDELQGSLPGGVPAQFDNYLRHGAEGNHPRFLVVFADAMREAVKSNPRYRDILLASGLSEIKAQGFDIAEFLFRLEDRFGVDSTSLRVAVERLDLRAERIETKVDDLTALVRDLIANATNAAFAEPGRPVPNVAHAVRDIAEGADRGDTRLATALDLLKANKVDEAMPLLGAFAKEKLARIAQDRTDAATAYRNLGIIAMLRDQKAALDAFAMAADLDPADVESLLWAGFLTASRGELGVAETRLRRVATLADENSVWQLSAASVWAE